MVGFIKNNLLQIQHIQNTTAYSHGMNHGESSDDILV